MRSQLTRSVFRRLLSSEGLIFHCRASVRRHNYGERYYGSLGRRIGIAPQRRMLWGFTRTEERKPKEPELAPGLDVFIEFSKMRRVGARPPPVNDLMQAWRKFFEHKLAKRQPVTYPEALHVRRLFYYLMQSELDIKPKALALKLVRPARDAMSVKPNDDPEIHIELAKVFHAELLKLVDFSATDTLTLTTTLARLGDTTDAIRLAQEHFTKIEDCTKSEKDRQRKVWANLMRAFAGENDEAALLQAIETWSKLGLPYLNHIQSIMTCFYAEKDNFDAAKLWYEKPLGTMDTDKSSRTGPKKDTLIAILKMSIRLGQLDWCKQVFRDVIQNEPSKEQWDVVFLWAAGAVGKGVEDVEEMIRVMIKRDPSLQPDSSTINGLVEFAISQKDPYLAERYIALGRKFNIDPDAETYILQLQYRIEAGDLRGAQSAYESLQSEKVLYNQHLPAVNTYIRALCASKDKMYDRITSILQDLEDLNVRLEADTCAAVAMLYMRRFELDDVYDTLQLNVYHYTIPERASIRDKFAEYIFDRSNNDAEAWEAYQVLHTIFDETDVELRTRLMNEFFDRGRSDMACFVFGHMRQHPLPARRPKLETYVACFVGIARLADGESLEMVHNMFKMDSSVEPNTLLYNSLMLAYASIEDGDRAMDFWDDITNSHEGPTYRSLEIVFRACEMKPFGDIQAREIWDKMRRMEIEVTREVWAAYIGALAGRGKVEDAMKVLENGEAEFGLKPDWMTLGIFYNSTVGETRKDKVEEWARGTYPEAWAELEKKGTTVHEEGYKVYNFQREWKA